MEKVQKKQDEKKGADKKGPLRKKKVLAGVVVKKSCDKTLKVEVSIYKNHPRYGKSAVKSKKYLVHDPWGEIEVGQKVLIVEARALSKHKKYVLVREDGRN